MGPCDRDMDKDCDAALDGQPVGRAEVVVYHSVELNVGVKYSLAALW